MGAINLGQKGKLALYGRQVLIMQAPGKLLINLRLVLIHITDQAFGDMIVNPDHPGGRDQTEKNSVEQGERQRQRTAPVHLAIQGHTPPHAES